MQTWSRVMTEDGKDLEEAEVKLMAQGAYALHFKEKTWEREMEVVEQESQQRAEMREERWKRRIRAAAI